MTNEEILEKSYYKAHNNGWDDRAYVVASTFLLEKGLASNTYYIFIFSHSWAKAFVESLTMGQRQQILDRADLPMSWANDMERVKDCFLQEMVVKEQPLKYIEKFI